MKLKQKLEYNKKKSDIPQVQSRILNEIGVMYTPHTRVSTYPRLVLQLSSMLLLISGAFIFGFQSVTDQVNAFESYDEVMITATSTAYYMYEYFDSDETLIPLSTHQDVIMSELPYMIEYYQMFESILVTQKQFDLTKEDMNTGTRYDFAMTDVTDNRRRIQMYLEKQVITQRKDVFQFEGTFDENYQLSGKTSFNGDSHEMSMTIQINMFSFQIEYQDIDQSYHIDVTNDDGSVLNINFSINYDDYQIPTVMIDYTRDGVTGSLAIRRSFRLGGFLIDYILDDQMTYEGIVHMLYQRISKNYQVNIRQDDGQTYRYTYERETNVLTTI